MNELRGVRLNKFWGNHLQIFNGMSVLDQVAHITNIRQITNMTYSKKRKIIFMVSFQMVRQICGNEYRNKWQTLLKIVRSKLSPFNTYLNTYNFSFFLKGFIQNSFLRMTSAYTCSTFYCFTIVTAQLNLKMSWILTW